MLKLLMSGHAYACLKKLREEGLSRGVFPLLDAVMGEDGDDLFLQLGCKAPMPHPGGQAGVGGFPAGHLAVATGEPALAAAYRRR
jgi:tRNA nucleotidyltransferase/poly(A) polymerase